jgi:hypothetical protein
MAAAPPPDSWGVITAFVITTISAFISISRRILSGHQGSWLWVISEYLTAILCGYLAYNAYPQFAPSLPEWLTLPAVLALAAHSGGRFFQELEKAILSNYAKWLNKKLEP